MGFLSDSFGWGFGFGFGSAATQEAFDIIENRYRAKDFDPVVRQDLKDILSKGMLAKRAYPFPTMPTKQKSHHFLCDIKFFRLV